MIARRIAGDAAVVVTVVALIAALMIAVATVGLLAMGIAGAS